MMASLLKNNKFFFVRLINICAVVALLSVFNVWATKANATDAATQAQINELTRASSLGPFEVDGTFTGSAQGFGGLIEVSVTVEDGYLTSIDIVSANNEDEAWLSEARAVIPAMLNEQSTNVDTISGATFSSTGIINATKSALLSANGGE